MTALLSLFKQATRPDHIFLLYLIALIIFSGNTKHKDPRRELQLLTERIALQRVTAVY